MKLGGSFTGLSVALVERDDFSSGTSSRSTKLIHGGVRYLQKAVMKLDMQQASVSKMMYCGMQSNLYVLMCAATTLVWNELFPRVTFDLHSTILLPSNTLINMIRLGYSKCVLCHQGCKVITSFDISSICVCTFHFL